MVTPERFRLNAACRPELRFGRAGLAASPRRADLRARMAGSGVARVGRVEWKRVGADWCDIVLVCRKCAKKLDGGFGPDADESLPKALRGALDRGAARKPKVLRRRVAVLEVGCLDVCPRKAVVVIKGSDPGSVILVPRGASMPELIERLGLGGGSPGTIAEPSRLSRARSDTAREDMMADESATEDPGGQQPDFKKGWQAAAEAGGPKPDDQSETATAATEPAPASEAAGQAKAADLLKRAAETDTGSTV